MESLQNLTPPGPPVSMKVQEACLIPKGAIKKTVFMFAVLLMITILAAFLVSSCCGNSFCHSHGSGNPAFSLWTSAFTWVTPSVFVFCNR